MQEYSKICVINAKHNACFTEPEAILKFITHSMKIRKVRWLPNPAVCEGIRLTKHSLNIAKEGLFRPNEIFFPVLESRMKAFPLSPRRFTSKTYSSIGLT